jgi:type IV pilus assembly protein PilZ
VFALAVPVLSEAVQITGEVQWISPPGTQESEAGMGIRFLFAADEERIRFERLVEGLMEHSLGPAVTRGLLGRKSTG